MVKAAPLQISLSIQPEIALAGEGISLLMSLNGGAAGATLPALLEESEALQFELYSESGDLISRVNGQEMIRRRGYGWEPMPASEIPEDTLGPGAEAKLPVNLLDLFRLPPGKYSVAAAVRHNGIDAVSDRHAITVVPARCAAASFATDQLCLPTLYCLLKLEGEGDAGGKVILEVRAASGAAGTLARIPLPPEVPGDARISVADFTCADSELDAVRWLAWVSDGRLSVLFASAEEQAKSVVHPALPFSVSELLGQPIQHEDGGTSLFVTQNSPDGVLLHRIRLEPAGAFHSSEQLGVLPCPGVSAISSRATPVRIAVEVPADRLILDGSVPVAPKDGENEIQWRVVGDLSNLKLKFPDLSDVSRVLSLGFDGAAITGVLTVGGSPIFWRSEKEGVPETVSVPMQPLQEGESVVAASHAVADGVGQPYVSVRTSFGRLLAGSARAELSSVEDADPNWPVCQLVASDSAGGLWVYYGREDGIGRRLLFTLPPGQ